MNNTNETKATNDQPDAVLTDDDLDNVAGGCMIGSGGMPPYYPKKPGPDWSKVINSPPSAGLNPITGFNSTDS